MRNSSTARQAPQANLFDLNRRILASPDLNLADKAVLLVILDHARHGQSTCTASSRTIAREARISERHVKNVLPKLQGRGLIVITRATGSIRSRHTITTGPCLHQVGNFQLKVMHEVSNDFREVGNSMQSPGQPNARTREELKGSEKDGFFLDLEEIDPSTRRFFGHLLPKP